MDERPSRQLLSGGPTEEDRRFDQALRPKYLNEFIGQRKVVENLAVYVQAARARGEALDHVILHGPPGIGKTTLAYLIANELGVEIKATSGPVIERSGDMAALLTNLGEREVLFVDEIHRLNPTIEEFLYPAMEEYKLDFIIGQGPAARSIKLDLPPFTLIGATTRKGLLTAPLRGRFGIDLHLDFYRPDDLQTIVLRSAKILHIEIEASGAAEIARRARGTPRVANRLLRRVRDFAQVQGDGRISREIADYALNRMEVDKFGLDEIDRKILLTIIEKFGGGPVGLGTISAAINEEKDAIEEIYEPYLIQIGFLNRTPRGRMATHAAYQHLGYDALGRPTRDQGGLFDR